MGRRRRCAACSMASWADDAFGADSFSSASSSRMPFLATMPMTMMRPMNEATLNVVPVIEQGQDHAGDGQHRRGENGDGRGEVAELGQQHAEDQRQRQQQHLQQIVEGFLLLLRRCRRTRRAPMAADAEPSTVCCTFCHHAVPRSEPSRSAVTTISRCRFSRSNLVLRRKLLRRRPASRASPCGRGAVEDGVLDGVERGAVLVAQPHANRVGAAVGDQRVVGGDAIEDRGRVFRDFGWA